jgi:ribonucleoside-triphosphate reductase
MPDNQKIQKCEVYSRVVGYLSPVSVWNKGKSEEFEDRQTYEVPGKKE